MTALRFTGVLAVTALAACSSGSGGTGPAGGSGHSAMTRTVGLTDSGRTIALSVGDRLRVRLDSTYWTLAGQRDGVLVGGRPVLAAAPGKHVPGSGAGTVTEVYSASSAGTTKVAASRVSCGEALRCVGAQGTFVLTVVVR